MQLGITQAFNADVVKNAITEQSALQDQSIPQVVEHFIKDSDFIPESLFRDVIQTLIHENDPVEMSVKL